jgi:hypothetical protein
MVRKSLFAALGFVGLLAAGTAATSSPAAAGYACGPWNNWCAPRCGAWNNWCRPVCGPWNGWCARYYRYPGFSFGYGYGPRYWSGYGGGHYAYRNGGGDWNGNHNGGGHYDRDGDRDDYDRNR